MAYQREIEMQAIPPPPQKPVILVENSFAVTISEPEKPVPEPTGTFNRLLHSFGPASNRSDDGMSLSSHGTAHGPHGRFFSLRRANYKSANTQLARELKNRHLQMIAFGGSIGMWTLQLSCLASSGVGVALDDI